MPVLIARIGLGYALARLAAGFATLVLVPSRDAAEALFRILETLNGALLIALLAVLVLSMERFIGVVRDYVLRR
jgi:hypothetical protein